MKNKYALLIASALISFSTIDAQVTPKKVFEIDTVYTNINSISIDGQFAKIDVTQSADETIKIKSELFSDSNDPLYKLTKTVTNQKLSLKITYPAKGWSSHSGYLQITIPKGKELVILTASGSVSIKATELAKVDVKTQSGNIEAISTNGPLNLETVTAKISVSSTTGNVITRSKTGEQFISKTNGNIYAYSSEGNMTISDIIGTVKTESTTGKADLDRIKGDVSSKAAAGWVNIAEVTGNINVITFSGPIKLFNNNGAMNIQSTTGEQVGTRLNLTGPSSFKSTEGKIKMDFDNKIEGLTLTLISDAAYIQAFGESKKKKLNMGKGSVVVTSYSTTGGQIFN